MFKSSLLLLCLLLTQLVYSQDSLAKQSGRKNILEPVKELQIVKSEIIRLLKNFKSDDWQTFHLIIEAPPYINKGFTMIPTFLADTGKLLTSFKPDEQFSKKVYDLIFRMNQNQRRNQIIFFTRRDDYKTATIFISFSQNIDAAFESYLPKSFKGKTVPWYKNNDSGSYKK
jgi:hypothetical protein